MSLRTVWTTVAVLSLAAAGTAAAHPKLLRSVPAANSTVAAPSLIVLNFSERLIAPMTGADVILTSLPNAGHPPVKVAGVRGALSPDAKSLVLTSAKPLQAGSYRVDWHAVATDTHRVKGSLAFTAK